MAACRTSTHQRHISYLQRQRLNYMRAMTLLYIVMKRTAGENIKLNAVTWGIKQHRKWRRVDDTIGHGNRIGET